MTLRIIFRSDKNTGSTMSYVDVECESWSASNALLVLIKPNGELRHYPLNNIECFMEVPSDVEAEA